MTNTNESIIDYITEFFRDLIKYWYVALLSLAIIMGGALFYLKYAAKTYKVTSAVLLKIERSNAFGANSDDMMRVYELIEQDKNLQNEVFFLKSTPLIRSVVEEMDLDVSYFIQEDKIPKEMEFSLRDLYVSTPFIVIPEKKHFQPINTLFYIKILDEESYQVSSYSTDAAIVDFNDGSVVYPERMFQLGGIYKFGEEVSNTYTSFRVLLNSNYNSEAFLGKDLFFRFNTSWSLTSIYKNNLEVEASTIDATMVSMSFNCDNVQKGIDFLDGLINKYIDNNLEEKNFLAVKTIEHLDFQLSDISETLGTSEQELPGSNGGIFLVK